MSKVKRFSVGNGDMWFRVDDIAISYIFEIAELYGLKVRITATPKNKATQLA
ncbi:MAG: hypothetical protein IJ623_04335 [Bacteroidales bacterium]|nr:hypothetical protein [Bacteroidales bacterium]